MAPFFFIPYCMPVYPGARIPGDGPVLPNRVKALALITLAVTPSPFDATECYVFDTFVYTFV